MKLSEMSDSILLIGFCNEKNYYILRPRFVEKNNLMDRFPIRIFNTYPHISFNYSGHMFRYIWNEWGGYKRILNALIDSDLYLYPIKEIPSNRLIFEYE